MAVKDWIISVNIPSLGTIPIKDKSATFKTHGYTRDHIAGEQRGDGGYVESNTPAELSITILADPRINLQDINEVRGENISISYHSGKSYTMYDAYCAEPAESTNGEITAKFLANEAEMI